MNTQHKMRVHHSNSYVRREFLTALETELYKLAGDLRRVWLKALPDGVRCAITGETL
jgi:hypothetical protein